MPTLQTVVPQETLDAIQRVADSRVPKDSVSRVAAEVLIPAFAPEAKKIVALATHRPNDATVIP